MRPAVQAGLGALMNVALRARAVPPGRPGTPNTLMTRLQALGTREGPVGVEILGTALELDAQGPRGARLGMWPRLRDQGCSSVQRAHIGPTVGDVVIAVALGRTK